jgi:hypothetical protein
MNPGFWPAEKVAGSLLVASLLALLFALIILITSGAMPGFSAMLQGSLAQVAPLAGAFRLLIFLFALGWIVQYLGLGLLALLLLRAGHEQLAILAFSLALVATVLAVLYTTFRMSVELWAAEEAARTGSIPDLLAPLKAWSNDFFRLAYATHLAAGATFGWGVVRSGIVAPAVGWAAIVWSVLWFVALALGAGAPAIPLLMPAVVGVALLRR